MRTVSKVPVLEPENKAIQVLKDSRKNRRAPVNYRENHH